MLKTCALECFTLKTVKRLRSVRIDVAYAFRSLAWKYVRCLYVGDRGEQSQPGFYAQEP